MFKLPPIPPPTNRTNRTIDTTQLEYDHETSQTSFLPPIPTQKQNIRFYPVIDKRTINTIKYKKNGKDKNIEKGDNLFLYSDSQYFPLGEQKGISINSISNCIKSYRENGKNTNFSEMFPQFSNVPIDDLPLYVGITSASGGKNNKKKSRRGRKSRRTKRRSTRRSSN